MKVDIIASDNLVLKALYSKADHPKAVVVIVHGMVEHKERYNELIEKLNDNGYTAIIADLRGHGGSVNEEYQLGMIGDIDLMVEDVKSVIDYVKSDTPNLRIDMFAHSMGSLIARMFIRKYSNLIDRLILSGTVAYKTGCGLGVKLAKSKSKGEGKNQYSKLLFKLSNNGSSKEDYSWLSYNKKNIEYYENDPLCGFKFTNFSNYVLFNMTYLLHKHDKELKVNENLRIMSISGIDDRTTNHTKGVKDSIKHLELDGFKYLSFKEYPKMKHEILKEDNKKEVFKDIVKFYNE